MFSKNMMTSGTHLGWVESEKGAAEKMDVHDAGKLQIQRTTNRVTKGPKSHRQSISFLNNSQNTDASTMAWDSHPFAQRGHSADPTPVS